jgi:hypothetical protein
MSIVCDHMKDSRGREGFPPAPSEISQFSGHRYIHVTPSGVKTKRLTSLPKIAH